MQERTLREIAWEANMELARRHLSILTWGNASQLDRERGIMAIKPSGIPFDALTPKNMVLVDVETGDVLSNELNPSLDTPTHLTLYQQFPEEICGIVHTHSPFATAWAQAGRALPCFGTTHADTFYGTIPVTRQLSLKEVLQDYERNTGYVILKSFTKISPIDVPAVLVCGHGPFAWGNNAMDAADNALVLEEVARIASMTISIAPNAEPLPDYVTEKHFLRKHGDDAYYGQK